MEANRIIMGPNSIVAVRRRWRHAIDVVLVLVARDFAGRYRNTGIGVVWSVLNPLMFLITFYVIFAKLLKMGIAHYACFAFIGILAWQWLQSSLVQSAESITGSATLAAQPGFPLGALPLAAVANGFVHFIIALPLLAVLILLEGVRIGWAALALPALLAVQALLLVGMGHLAAAINVRYRDTQHILPVLLQVGYFLTPIFYDQNAIAPEHRWLFAINPMSVLIEGYRSVLLHETLPSWQPLLAIVAGSLLLILIARNYFERQRDSFLEEL